MKIALITKKYEQAVKEINSRKSRKQPKKFAKLCRTDSKIDAIF